MKKRRFFQACGCALALVFLADAPLAAATHKKKPDPEQTDEDKADADATPASRRSTHGKTKPRDEDAPAAESSPAKRSKPKPGSGQDETKADDAAGSARRAKSENGKPKSGTGKPDATEDDAASASKRSTGEKDKAKTGSGKESSSERDDTPGRKDSSADEAAVPPATTAAKTGGSGSAATSSIETKEIADFDAQPEPIRKLLAAALELTKRNLTYAYGSADPSTGGMDCSGTIYYVLKEQGFTNVPRQSSDQYSWVRKESRIYPVISKKQDNEELNEMRPGDLLFWTGTYNIDRDPPITHVMIYLGKRKKDGKRLMFGSSDGRSYDGQRKNGVSVFDFKLPAARSGDKADAATAAAPDHSPNFAGYGPIPGIAERTDAAKRESSGGAAASKPK